MKPIHTLAANALAVSLTRSFSSNKRVYTTPWEKMCLSHSAAVFGLPDAGRCETE